MSNPAVQAIVDQLPPATWDVSVWLRTEVDGVVRQDSFVNGRIDPADVHRIIRLVLGVQAALRPCVNCQAPVIVAVHDTGNPLAVDPEPDEAAFLTVWVEDGLLRVSGAPHRTGAKHHPHRCQTTP